ncbi:MAG TPA: sialidase family protein [Prolixibacteraceae bacterium]|nr:sialidase family protein [Prolixibacteraceae bacterium]HPT32906.1 sialidase family protein [Prolixibacteraceae bacterium]
MKVLISVMIFLLFTINSCSDGDVIPVPEKEKPLLEIYEKFAIYDGSMPNGWNGDIMVARDGSVLADRRSIDGGVTWGPKIPLLGGAGRVLDETTGDILKLEPGAGNRKPDNYLYRSRDNGLTWVKENVIRHPDVNGWVPIISGCEEGITLRYGKHKGRLLLPSRVMVNYNSTNDSLLPYHYSSANYSDDGGKTWYSSAPFPVKGTGEAALVELSDGTIYYNSRNHNRAGNRDIAFSYDGGETWTDNYIDPVLPDGPPNVYGCKGGLARLEIEGYDVLIFSMNDNPNGPTAIHSTEGRINMTVWASFDGGKTWPVKRLVHKTGGYSHLASGRPGTPSAGWIYLTTTGLYARFNLAWVTWGRDWKEFLPEKNL